MLNRLAEATVAFRSRSQSPDRPPRSDLETHPSILPPFCHPVAMIPRTSKTSSSGVRVVTNLMNRKITSAIVVVGCREGYRGSRKSCKDLDAGLICGIATF